MLIEQNHILRCFKTNNVKKKKESRKTSMEAIITDQAVDYKNNLSKGSRNEEQEILRNFRGAKR